MALDGAKVSGRAVALGATTAIMDSGTTAILVSSADAAAIHQVRTWPTVPGCHALHQRNLTPCMQRQLEDFWVAAL